MIYLDNAATSFPKPREVAKAVYKQIAECGANAGRGGHAMSKKAMDVVWSCREELGELMGVRKHPERIIFTKNATEGLNLIIRGMKLNGKHVITTPYEHNSVVRPLNSEGANVSCLPLTPFGDADVDKITDLVNESTALVILCHSSNVSGVITNIKKAVGICKKLNIPLLIDAAQTAGIVEIDAEEWGVAIAFAGHKGLLGPQGTGAVYIPDGIDISPLTTGGTGSNSESLSQPDILPDKYESGTINLPAIAGLLASVRFIEEVGQNEILEHERILAKRFIQEALNINGIRVLCPENVERTGVVSMVIDGVDVSEAAYILDNEFTIATRAGLHCAPLAHKSYDTLQTGTLRLSSGWFNTFKDIDKALFAINSIVLQYRKNK